MSAHHAVLTVWHSEGALEYERRVDSLEALFEACKKAPPSRLVRVTLEGPDGEVTLQFASFMHRA